MTTEYHFMYETIYCSIPLTKEQVKDYEKIYGKLQYIAVVGVA